MKRAMARPRRDDSDTHSAGAPLASLRTWQISLCAIGLASVIMAIYWQVLGYQFVNFDDDAYVYLNSHVKAGLTLDNIRWAFIDNSNGNWHPLTWISHMLDVQLFGLNAGPHHFVNVLWHAANSVLLMFALWFMTGKAWRSAFVAALFALHPLRVESVAWIAERKDVLSSFFYILTIWSYAWYARRPRLLGRYAVVAVFLSLGLMTKASVVTAPFLLLLLDYWPLCRKESLGLLVREKIPLFVLAAGVSIATYVGQSHVGATRGIENLHLADRLANVPVSYMHYLGKIFWPQPLAVIYPYQRDLPVAIVISACLLLGVITTLVLFTGRRFRHLPVGWFWFLGVMVPMIGVVQVGWQAYADRYTYIPSIGIFLALVWMVADAIDHSKWQRVVAIGAAVAILPALAFKTWSQLPYWHDDLALFQHALDSTIENPIAQYHVGDDLLELGRNREAIPHLQEMIRLSPTFYAGYYTLGKAQAAEGDAEPAVRSFSQALRIWPEDPAAFYARAVVLLETGSDRPAELDFRAALKYGLAAQYAADAYNSLGIILAQRGDIKGATVEFERAVQLQPALVPAQQNLAVSLMKQGRTDEALAHLRQALSATNGDASLKKMFDDFQSLGPIR
jgi:tetratricopeptide (TPR) repeat protein